MVCKNCFRKSVNCKYNYFFNRCNENLRMHNFFQKIFHNWLHVSKLFVILPPEKSVPYVTINL